MLFLSTDVDTGAILDVNEKMCEMYGYIREEVLRADIGLLSAGEPPYAIHNALEWISKAAQGEPQFFEWKAKHKDGHLFWIDVKMRRVTISGVDRLLVAVTDITMRKQAEERLISANKQLEDIIEFLPDATLIVNNDKKIIAWNHAMEEITGVPKKDILWKDHSNTTIPFYGP